MTKSERLKLIRQIAEKLGTEELSIINLTLEEFNIPVSRNLKLKPFDYILGKLQSSDTGALSDLAHHLEIETNAARPQDAVFWKKNRLKIFISHLAREKKTAAELRDELEKFGISAFVAHEDISPSRQWQNDIETALFTCNVLVALMSKGFHASHWTDQEVGFAFGRGLPVIPVNKGEKPYGFIGRIQYYKFEDIPSLSETIFKLLTNDQRTSKSISYAVMDQFENSVSFAASYQNLKVLRKIKFWDQELLERLKLAPRKNNQIKGSFDVPEGVKTLVKKISAKLNDIA